MMGLMEDVMPPPIVKLKRELGGERIEVDLSQGVPFFSPPKEALEALFKEDLHALSRYTPDEGLPSLREAVAEKLRSENGIHAAEGEVMITPGANYAFFIALSATVRRGGRVALLAPYYFNHLMAVQILGGVPHIVPWGGGRLNLEGVEEALDKGAEAVVLVNPSNPTGLTFTRQEVKALLELTEQRGAYLLSDETYEHFTFSGRKHTSPAALSGGNGVVSIFSMSKSFGMGGWRVGYLHYPQGIEGDLLKAQDTVGICSPNPSQRLAEILLREHSPHYPRSMVPKLERSLEGFTRALDRVGVRWVGGEGAFYLLVKCPPGVTGWEAAKELARRWGVLTVPGEPFGAGGYLRVSFGNLPPERSAAAADRLGEALEELYGSFEGKGLKYTEG
ncbi:MAG: hypothetical protein DRN55_03435 [Thermoplasmata archaeon]|nr:MAG: hypothetical protein DRN55_03435 [Thermoplasmata archaeon]